MVSVASVISGSSGWKPSWSISFLESNTQVLSTFYIYSIVSKLCIYTLAHRALADVEAMERLFVSTPLVALLSALPTRSGTQEVDQWHTQQCQHSRCTQILSSLGKHITAAQAKRLDVIGLSFEVMLALCQSCPDDESFIALLKVRGVNSKPLREKLACIVK